MGKRREVVVIAGPTASGKSGLAAALAQNAGGVVINADSLQLYDALPILTASPGPELTSRAPHALYGVVEATSRVTAAWWATQARATIDKAHAAGQVPILVGGTGLYLEALMQGIAPVPEIPAAVKRQAQADMETLGHEAFRDRLVAADPSSQVLKSGDTHRLLRAWEVLQATGRPLSAWHGDDTKRSDYDYLSVLILPPRDILRAACDLRFLAMIEVGAVEEVRGFLGRYDAAAPVTRALGFAGIAASLTGGISQREAIERGQAETRQYAKRQSTWFRNRFRKRTPSALVLETAQGEAASHLLERLRGFNHNQAFIAGTE